MEDEGDSGCCGCLVFMFGVWLTIKILESFSML
jgi:hypothetical protein